MLKRSWSLIIDSLFQFEILKSTLFGSLIAVTYATTENMLKTRTCMVFDPTWFTHSFQFMYP
jgi:hypothetical protein